MQQDVLGSQYRKLSVAVVAPIYGGTVPIAHSVARTLRTMGHMVYLFDFANFADSYASIADYGASRADVFSLQGEFAEVLSRTVVEGLKDREVNLVIALAQAPLSVSALDTLRARGITTALWYLEDCRRFSAWKEIAGGYDFVFTIQKGEILNLVKEAGAGDVHYLPAACDPTVHQPMTLSDEEKKRWGAQVSFVGAGYHNRVQLFASLPCDDFKIWGTEWPAIPPFTNLVQEEARRLSVEEYVKVFNASAINLNLHSSTERNGVDPTGDFVNPRTFELAACGAFQLTDSRSLLAELFAADEELVTFDSRESLIDKVRYFRTRPSEREKFAQAAQKRALAQHTYKHRMEEMLDYISQHRQFNADSNSCEWQNIMREAEKLPELKNRLELLRQSGGRPTLTEIVSTIPVGKEALNETDQALLFCQMFMAQANGIPE